MVYYTIYKTSNKVTGKVYIGAHKTSNLNDGYLGSGKYLNYAINKHGVENFSKEILHVFDNPEDMFNKEAEIVNKDFIAEENTYNLKVGGFGGWDYINSNEEARIQKNRRAREITDSILLEKYGDDFKSIIGKMSGKNRTPESFKQAGQKIKATILERYGHGTFKNKKHTQETKDAIGANSSKCQQGSGNSQYGTMWITDGTINKKIKKNDTIPEGFKKGRVLKQE